MNHFLLNFSWILMLHHIHLIGLVICLGTYIGVLYTDRESRGAREAFVRATRGSQVYFLQRLGHRSMFGVYYLPQDPSTDERMRLGHQEHPHTLGRIRRKMFSIPRAKSSWPSPSAPTRHRATNKLNFLVMDAPSLKLSHEALVVLVSHPQGSQGGPGWSPGSTWMLLQHTKRSR